MKDSLVSKAVAWVTLYGVLRALAPHLRVRSEEEGVVLGTILFMFLALMVVASFSRIPMRTGTALLSWLLFAGLFIVTGLLRISPAADLALILSATSFGILVSQIIREPQLLVPVALVAAIVDYWGVNYGTTKMMMSFAPRVLGTVGWTVPRVGSLEPATIMGPGDFVFLGLFFACIARFRLNWRRSILLIYLFLLVSMLLVYFSRLSVPALVPMAGAVLAANIRCFRLKRSEWFALLYAGMILAAITAVGLLTWHFVK